MCSILGFSYNNSEQVTKINKLLKHRGPDSADTYNDNFISLGHNRLSIIDIDDRSSQPMWSNDGTVCVVFNGEIYNYKELKQELVGEYNFKTESDTEVLIALYLKYGKNINTYLRGMYAFAIYNSSTKELYLYRDEQGIKPLYYAYVDNNLYFASEIKAIIALFGSNSNKLDLDEESLGVFLTLGYTIAPRTLYKNIAMLEPGKILFFDLVKKIKPEIYSSNLNQNKLSLNEKSFFELIEAKILSNLVSDVPVGIFFSGGTDSSLIASVLNKHKCNLETFSLRIEGRTSDEYYFNNISDKLKLKKNVYYFDTQAFDSIYQEILKKIDSPSGCTSIFQTYYLAKKAREKVKVVLMGDGGDEIFFGYNRSLSLAKMRVPNESNGIWLEKIYFFLPHIRAKNFVFSKLFSLMNMPISYYLINMSLARDFGTFSNWEKCRKQINLKKLVPSEYDKNLYLQNDLLFKNDAATSYCSIEGRFPLLDQDIISNSPPFAKMSIKNKVLKYSLKRMLSGYLDNKFVYRNKSGFGINFKDIVSKSMFVHDDFMLATKYLSNINHPLKFSYETYAKQHPQFILVVILLWKSLTNNQNIYEEYL